MPPFRRAAALLSMLREMPEVKVMAPGTFIFRAGPTFAVAAAMAAMAGNVIGNKPTAGAPQLSPQRPLLAGAGGGSTRVCRLPGRTSQLVLDPGGNPGSVTRLRNSSSVDLTLRNGARGLATVLVNLGDVIISSNASIVFSNIFTTFNCSNLTVQA